MGVIHSETSVDPSKIVTASATEPGAPQPTIAEGIVIPPDPERGENVAESFESMCIDAEVYLLFKSYDVFREVQLDLVSVIRSMILYRYICIIMVV